MEGKKSIILYTDMLDDIVNDLSDEQAGKLMKTVVNYVNDRHPPEPEEPVIRMAWKIIRNQLKRDLKKWNQNKEKKSNGAKFGNLKRWHHDLYLLVQAEKMTMEEAFEVAAGRSSLDTDTKQSPAISNRAENHLPNANGRKENEVRLQENDNQDAEPEKEDTETNERIRKATKVIADFFAISEIRQSGSFLKIGKFVRYISIQGNLDWLSDQFKAYVEFKEKKGFKHSWENFTGTIENEYEDGAWNKENWIVKAKELKKGTAAEHVKYRAPRTSQTTI